MEAITLTIFLCLTALVDGQTFDLPALYQLTEPVDHSESPTWEPRKNILFYVDIHSGGVYSYNYNTTAVNHITLNGTVAPVIPVEGNENLLIVGLNRSVVAVEWDGTNQIGKQKILTTVSEQFPESRFNEGKADKNGRLWIGTMGPEDAATHEFTPNQGVLYEVTSSNLNSPDVILAPVNISNGLAWNAANDKLFYIDSRSHQVVQYDFDLENGTISNKEVVLEMYDHPELSGNPDGLTIDEDDNLWIAVNGGGCVIQLRPKDKKILNKIAIPAKHITSAVWGGPNLDVLFVTTSRFSLSDQEKLFYPAAGSVFAITNLKTKGKEQMRKTIDKYNAYQLNSENENSNLVRSIAKIVCNDRSDFQSACAAVWALKSEITALESDLFGFDNNTHVVNKLTNDIHTLKEYLLSGPTNQVPTVPVKIMNLIREVEEHLANEKKSLQNSTELVQDMKQNTTRAQSYMKELWICFLVNPSKIPALLKRAEKDYNSRLQGQE